MYAYLGRAAEVNLGRARSAHGSCRSRRDAYKGGSFLAAQAVIESRTGRQDAALEKLEYLLSIPSVLARPLLRVDPAWDALRTNPRFRRLVGDER